MTATAPVQIICLLAIVATNYAPAAASAFSLLALTRAEKSSGCRKASSFPTHDIFAPSNNNHDDKERGRQLAKSFQIPSVVLSASADNEGRGDQLLKPSRLQSIVLNESIEDISDQISSRIVLPFYVPQPILKAATTLTLQVLTNELALSSQLLDRIGQAAALAAATISDERDEDASDRELNDIADELAKELNAAIDFPILDEAQECVVFRSIGRAALVVLTSPDQMIEIEPKELVDAAVETVQDLLSEKGRAELAASLNAKVDFPLLDEEGEEKLLRRAVDACADLLMEALPVELMNALRGKGATADGLEQTKDLFVDSVNRKIDVMGLSEEQEAWIIRSSVDVLFDALLDDTEAELLLMSHDERISELVQRRTVLKRRAEISRRRYEAERASLEAQIRTIDEQLQAAAE